MATIWHRHDAGFFNLEVPSGWVVQHPNAGTLLLQDPDSNINLTLLAITRTAQAPAKASALDARAELQKWIDTQRHIHARQAPRLLAGMPYPTATTEGLQQIRTTAGPWYRRLLQRLKGARRLLLWRFWGILNPHLLILANCYGTPAALERHRSTTDRLMASIRLPQREILLGRAFAEAVESLARADFPRAAVSIIDEGHLQFGALSVGLAPLHRRYLARPEALPEQVRSYLSKVQEDVPASKVAASWARAREQVMPLFLTENDLATARDRLVHEEWINGLAIGYALEEALPAEVEGGMPQRKITHDDLLRWKVNAQVLHEQALQNLVLYSREHVMEGRRAEGLLMLRLASPDRHNAARILLPELHRKLREHLGATFYAAMPARDILVAFSSADQDVLAHLRRDLEHDYRHAREALSPKFFQVTPDGIAGDPLDAEDIII